MASMEDHVKALEKKIEEQNKILQDQSKTMQALMQMMQEMKESSYNSPRSGTNGGHYSKTPGSKREEHMETASDMEATLEKKKKHKSKKRKPNSDETNVENMETTIGEIVSSGTAMINADTGSKREEHIETTSNMEGTVEKEKKRKSKKRKPNSDENLNPQNMETAIGETATVDQKREVLTLAAGGEKCTVPKRIENMKITNGETVSSGTAIIDANTGSKREEHIETATNVEEGTLVKKKKQKSKKRKPNSDEILNPQNMETTIGETATVDQKREVLTLAAGGEKCTVPKRIENMKITNGETVSSGTAIIDANTGSKREEHIETATNVEEGTLVKIKKQKSKKRKPNFDDILNPQNMETAIGEMGTGTTATVDQKREVLTLTAGDEKSTVPKREENMKITNGETVSSGTAIIDANTGSKREEHIETATNVEEGTLVKRKKRKSKKRKSNSDENLNPQNMETTIGEMGTGTGATVDQKREVSTLAACDENNTMSKREEHLETLSNERVSVKIPAFDKKMDTKGEEQPKVVNGNMSLSAATNLDVEGTVENQKKPNSSENSITHQVKIMETINGDTGSGKTAGENLKTHHVKNMGLSGPSNLDVKGTVENQKNPNSGEILNTHDVKNMETTVGDTGTSKTATDTTESNKRKRETLENNNPPSTGEMVTVNQGSDTTKVLGNGNMDVSKNTYHGEKGAAKPKNYHRSNPKLPTIGEILNPQFLELRSEYAINSNKKNKQQMLKNQKPETVNIAPGAESTMFKSIADKGKKLLVFDVNGFLADIVFFPIPQDVKADKLLPKRAIFKRPYLDDFLRFCFERFNVAIWSSRTKQVLDPVVDFLFRDSKKDLLFVWDASMCTNSMMRTLENRHKFIVFKNLRKIWKTNGPNGKWVIGTFNESNTLLLDDSPYKALINPKYTGIFPTSYSYKNRDDNFLGPNGDFRKYLEGLAESDNVKRYVEQHPFGQGDMDEQHPNWSYYSRLLNGQKFTRESA